MKADEIKETKKAILDDNKLQGWMKELALLVLYKYGKHIYANSWTSGSCTEVCPFMFWPDKLEIQLENNDKRHFPQKGIDRIVSKIKQVTHGYFCKNDGSCPDTLVFRYERKKED